MSSYTSAIILSFPLVEKSDPFRARTGWGYVPAPWAELRAKAGGFEVSVVELDSQTDLVLRLLFLCLATPKFFK